MRAISRLTRGRISYAGRATALLTLGLFGGYFWFGVRPGFVPTFVVGTPVLTPLRLYSKPGPVLAVPALVWLSISVPDVVVPPRPNLRPEVRADVLPPPPPDIQLRVNPVLKGGT